MIACVYGTTGELIKLAPVLQRLEKRGATIVTLCTGQQAHELTAMADELSIPTPDLMLGEGFRGNPLAHAKHIPTWLAQVVLNFAYSYRRLRRQMRSEPSVLIVHGDTFTTVLGALFGRALGVPVAHVEAGMRSGDIRNPFPEELNRRLAAWLVKYHFAPGPVPAANVARRPGVVINTGMNTVRDSLDLVPDHLEEVEAVAGGLPRRFGIVSLHRYEFLNDEHLVRGTLEALADAALKTPLLFVDHAVTRAKLTEYGLDHLFDDRFRRIPKLPYFAFVTIVRRSAFAVTDSGGLQQESYYLDHPCLVHRARTETPEGVGQNVILSGLDLGALRTFLADPEGYKLGHPPEGPSPSDIIVETLVEMGYCP